MDAQKHKVTLEFPDGSSKKVKVGKKVDLSSVPIGANLKVQLSEGLAFSLRTP